jgi:hypothetical protein
MSGDQYKYVSVTLLVAVDMNFDISSDDDAS